MELERRDVELCKAFQSIIKQGKFEIKGEAVAQCGGLFKWFMELDKKLEAAILAAPPKRKELE
jgi:hypothetical protein